MGKWISTYLVTSQEICKADKWQLHRPLKYYSEELNKTIIVNPPFYFDKNSVPTLLRWLVPKCGSNMDGPSALHDILYVTESLPRRDCDIVYKEAANDAEAHPIRKVAAFIGVRLAGWIVWKFHTEEQKAAMRKHIIIKEGR